MKIGIDLDETISEGPEFFAILSAAFLAAGHEVHVVTFREPGTHSGVETELDAHGLSRTAVHLPIAGELPPAFKARIAAELGLDWMIDDSPEVLAAMPVGTRRLWLCDPEVFDLRACLDVL